MKKNNENNSANLKSENVSTTGSFKSRLSKSKTFQISTKRIALMSILLSLGTALSVATLPPVFVFGRMSLMYAFCFLCGIWLGPFYGFIVGFSCDILNVFILNLWSTYVPQVSISTGLMATFMGIIFHYTKIKNINIKITLAGIITLFACSAGLNAWGESIILFDIYPYTLAKSLGASLNLKSKYLMIALSKLITQSFWIFLNCVLTVFIYTGTKTVFEMYVNNLSYTPITNNAKDSNDKIE